MELLHLFKKHLLEGTTRPSKVTVKNYVADVRKFILWFEQCFQQTFDPKAVTPQVVEQFRMQINPGLSEAVSVPARSTTHSVAGGPAARSLKRYLSSLRKFYQFLQQQGLADSNPFEVKLNTVNQSTDPWRLKEFNNYLYTSNASKLTIKNYLADVRQFIAWFNKVVPPTQTNLNNNIFSRIDSLVLEEYKIRLLEDAHFSPVSVNRKLSSMRKYLGWVSDLGMINEELPKNIKIETLKPVEKHIEPLTLQKIVSMDDTFEPSEDHGTPDNETRYSIFPPIRLVQKNIELITYLSDLLILSPLVMLISFVKYNLWRKSGRKIFAPLDKVIDSSLEEAPEALKTQMQAAAAGTKAAENVTGSQLFGSFKNIGQRSSWKRIRNIPKTVYAPLEISTKNLPLRKKILHYLRHTRPQWYKTYHSYPIVQYFHWAIFIIFAAAIGFSMYSAFFGSPGSRDPALAAPSAPPRILSFQGRLTDSTNTPITAATTLRFGIYNNQTATGSAMLWQETQTVTPDQDGIFSALLGKGVPLSQSVFANNPGLYLGVTVGRDEELKPRQQLATVAFAANSETLQGLAPITQTGAGTNNVILALDSAGNLTIGGTATPTFQATGGAFSLAGQALILASNAGSNGNISLRPDGSGIIDLQKPLQNTTNYSNISGVSGAVEVDDSLAISATSSAQAALIINQNSTGQLISAKSSGSAKFSLDNTGTATLSGNLTVNGNSLTTSSTTINVFNTTATTVNLAGASTALSLGATTGTTTIRNNLAVTGSVASNLLPSTHNTYNLGSSTYYWKDAYITNLYTASSATISGFFKRSSGAVSPYYPSDDLLIGADSTASAKFQISGTTGNATTSGSLTFNTTGTIQTTRNQNLTIGGATTGDINLSPRNSTGKVNVNGTLNLASGMAYQINNTNVLSATALGSSIVDSSLTSVGALSAGSIVDGFGTITTSDTITGTVINGTFGINSGNGDGVRRIDETGNLVNINTTQFNGQTYVWPNSPSLGDNYLLTTDAAGGLTWQALADLGGGLGTITGVGDVSSGEAFTPMGTGSNLYFHSDITNGIITIDTLTSERTYVLPDVSGTFTLMGNTFNGANQLVQLNGSTQLPAVSGELLTSLNAANLASGTVNDLRLSSNVTLLGNNTTGSDSIVLATSPEITTPTFTTSATTPLLLGGALAGSGLTLQSTSGNGTTDFISFKVGNNGATEAMKILNNGSIGIGTDSTLAKLDIRGNGTTAIASVSGQTSFAGLVVDNAGPGDLFTASSSGQNRFVIKQNGAVGIGKDPTNIALDVNSIAGENIVASLRSTTTPTAGFRLQGSGADFWDYQASDVDYRIETNDNPIFTLHETGRLGIGANNISPLATLDVRGVSGSESVASISGTTTQAALRVENEGAGDLFTAIKSGATQFTIKNNGEVQIADLANCDTIKTDENGNLSCGGFGNTEAFTDNTNETLDDADMDLWDGTYPNITPNTTSNSVFVTVSAKVDYNGGSGTYFAFTIHRDIGADPTCSDTQVGNEIGVYGDNTRNPGNVTASFIDTPGSASNVRYTLCSSDTADGLLTNGSTPDIRFSLVELGADLAENYYTNDDTISAGTVVSIDASLPAGVKKSITAYDKQVLGIVSSAPGHVLDDKIGDGFGRPVPVALSGRVPVKVTTVNGPIEAGDYITASDIPGVAMRATEAGQVIGKALNGYSNPDTTAVGSTLVFVNLSWYAGETPLELGDITVATVSAPYSLVAKDGDPITAIGNFAQAAIANIQAGLVSVKELTADSLAITSENITIGGQSLREYIASVVASLNPSSSTPPISPISHINLISPLASNSAIALKLDKDKISILNSSTASGSVVATIDNEGNASFSGTLRAKNIIADNIDGLDAKLATLAANLNQFKEATSSSTLSPISSASPSATPTPILPLSSISPQSSSPSANLQNSFLQMLSTQQLPLKPADISSYSGQFTYIPNLKADFASFNEGLVALGPSSLADTAVRGRLSVGENMYLQDSSINTVGSDLNIQPLRQGNINFMGGMVAIDMDGNLNVNGNANFAKDVTVKGTLAANFIAPVPGEDLIIKLPDHPDSPDHPDLVIKDGDNKEALRINNKGDIHSSGSGIFSKLSANAFTIIRGAQADTSLTETVASGSAGTVILTANETQRTIFTPHVTKDSLIYITSVSNTQGETPYIARQTAEDKSIGTKGSFTIQIASPVTKDIKVNWWIVN